MSLRCFYCGHCLPLDQGGDTFHGPLRCRVCKNVMMVRVERGLLRAMAPCPQAAPNPDPAPSGAGPAALVPSPGGPR